MVRCGSLGAEHGQDELSLGVFALVGCDGSEVEQGDSAGLRFLICEIPPVSSSSRGC